MHEGGAVNVMMPAFLALALAGGLAFSYARSFAPLGRRGVAVALGVQITLLGFDPRGHVPSEADRAAGAELVALLRSVDGDVLVPFHGHLERMAGKTSTAHFMAVLDLPSESKRFDAPAFVAAYLDSARTREAELVVLDTNVSREEEVSRFVVPGFEPVGVIGRSESTLAPRRRPGDPAPIRLPPRAVRSGTRPPRDAATERRSRRRRRASVR